MPTIKFSDNPNEETAFVTQDGGQRNRAVLTAALSGTIKYPDNPNSTKVTVVVDGVERKAVAVADINGSGGGGDQHNLGYYATQAALEEAHPTAEAGDWAILGSTDTVWIWDTDNSEWVDSDKKGQVTSVNNQTGAVVLDAQDVGAVPQYSSMPTASASNEGWIVQYTGTTDANYTHGYIYECKAQGTTPDETYAWEAVEVQAGGGGSSYTAGTGIDITNDTISVSPTSYSPSGYKVRQLVLYGDSELDVYSNSTAYSVSHGFQAGYGYVNISSNTNAPSGGVVIGDRATSNGSTGQVLIGEQASSTAAFNIAIGSKASVTAQGAIQLGDGGVTKTNSDANTFKVGNANGNYELMSADGTVPTARLTKVNTTATLAVADWSSSTQTVTVSGVKADSVVFVSPDPASASDYASAGILCTSQSADSLTFTAITTPSVAIDVNIVCL